MTYPIPWIEHPTDSPTIADNVALLDARISDSQGSRDRFSLATPRNWHTEIHRNCAHIPIQAYVGNYRGSDYPHLRDYNIRFSGFLGTPPHQVGSALLGFEANLNSDLDRLDAQITQPEKATPSRINTALEAVAQHYALWLKIHPFADGNGRTARVLANFILARYWQPLILPGRPPVDRGGLIAATSPAIAYADHRPLTRYFRKRLTQARQAATRSTTR